MGVEKLLSNILHASPWWVRLLVSRIFLWPTIAVKRLAWALGWDIAGQCCPWNRVHEHARLEFCRGTFVSIESTALQHSIHMDWIFIPLHVLLCAIP